jgi:signal transduction histidine kinase
VLVVVGQLDLWLQGDGFRGPRAANALFLVASALPLLWRRRAPLTVFAAVFAVVFAGMHALYGLVHQPPVEPWLALIVAVYTLAAYESGRRLWLTLAVAGAATLASDVAAAVEDAPSGETWPPWLFYALAVILGRGLHRRRGLTAALQERTVELAAEREEKARLAVIEERARIARELHDVIAHTLSVVVLKAAVQRRALGDDRPETGRALAEIEEAGRESLVELRRLLGVLRRPSDPAAPEPQPGLAALDGLFAQVRDAGLELDVAVEGEAVRLPPGLDLAAYRVVQEALTNAIKHAGAGRVVVSVRYRGRELALDVVDDGRGHGNGTIPGAGQGLIGMRERVELYGGELRTGRRPGSGFEVSARFPLWTQGLNA